MFIIDSAIYGNGKCSKSVDDQGFPWRTNPATLSQYLPKWPVKLKSVRPCGRNFLSRAKLRIFGSLLSISIYINQRRKQNSIIPCINQTVSPRVYGNPHIDFSLNKNQSLTSTAIIYILPPCSIVPRNRYMKVLVRFPIIKTTTFQNIVHSIEVFRNN